MPSTRSESGNGCGGAVEKRQWYIAVVRYNTEKSARERLEASGYEVYVATQKEMHNYKCGHKKEIEKVIIPTCVFIHATEKERLQALKDCPLISFYMMDRAAGSKKDIRRQLARIPDNQMQQLMFMLFHAPSPAEFTSTLKKGDPVRVGRGPLRGQEGYFVCERGRDTITVVINTLGSISVQISRADVVPLN